MAGGDGLKRYRDKRDFKRSAEPEGEVRRSSGARFVVQKHDASQLHFDFRLELDGVLKSWAVTKGPSLDPSDKRLAVRTEDHPVDYADFEGVIEEGYGAGVVMIWDRGEWEPEGDPEKGLDEGELKFTLNGERMKGGWALVRMDRASDGDQENWLLIKEADDDADRKRDVRRRYSDSVVSGRDMDEIDDEEGARLEGVRLTHPGKTMYPDSGETKRDVAEHLVRMSDRMLPHVKDRPVSLVRCPDGAGADCFFQKHWSDAMSDALKTTRITERSGETKDYLLANDAAGLVAGAQIGALEFHVWGSRRDKLEKPDRLVFDLDPGEGATFDDVRRAAREVRARLEADGLESFALLTGGKGVHVVVPLQRRQGWHGVKTLARGLARAMSKADPDRYVAEASKAKRTGRIFIDWLRNDRGATAIAPFSPRARTGAPVATPVRWDELGGVAGGNAYTLANIASRLERLKSDPWEGYFDVRQSLTKGLIERYEEA
mgnify:FL=1